MKRQPVATVVAATSTSSSTSAPLNPATSVTATGAGPPTTIVVAPTQGASCSPLPTKTRPVTVRPRFSAPIPQVSHFAQRAAVNQVPAAFTVSPRAVVDVAFQNKDGPIVRPVLRRVEGSAGQNTPVFVSVAGTVVAGKVSPAVQFPTGGFPTRPPSNSMAPLNAVTHATNMGTIRTTAIVRPVNASTSTHSIRARTVSVTPSTQLVPSIPNQQVQRLKVEDALSYLDKVKYKFSNDPGVYNNFLDIMKEFKSQTLSTPGVIKRVSSLFEDHPELIVGFNTFLPPGYKIEIATIETGSRTAGEPKTKTTTLIHTPDGIHELSHAMDRGRDSLNAASVVITPTSPLITRPVSVADANAMLTLKTSMPITERVAKQSSPIGHSLVTTVAGSLVAAPSSSVTHINACTIPVTLSTSSAASTIVVSSSNVSSAVSAAIPVLTSNTTHSNDTGATNSVPQVEFDHAISYVNKIKLRFNHRPEIYKQFLEILHSYQKDQKDARSFPQGPAGLLSFPPRGANTSASKLSEAEVYAKVKKLFENQDDLLHEFSQFLPEATGNNVSLTTKMLNEHGSLNKLGGSSMIQTVHSMATSIPPPGLMSTSVASINQDSSKLPPLSNLPRTKPGFSQNSVMLVQSSHQGFQNRQSGASVHRKPVEQVLSSPLIGTKRAVPPVTNGGQPVSLNGQPPAKKVRMSAGRPGHLAATAKFSSFREFSFFNQVKKTLGDASKYQVLLRLVALYNLEVVSKVDLLGSFQELLGDNPELLKFVKNFVKHPNNWPSVASAEGAKKHSAKDKTPVRLGVEGAPGVELVVGVKSADEPLIAKETPKVEGPGIWMNGRSTRYCERDMDFSNARRLGASYCEVPKERQRAENFSNYTPLCREVLNHEWVSFPSWSEDSTFVSMRKTQYEEYIYRCEDERYELDMLIETNKRAIDHFERILENVHKMSPEERSGYCLDPSLGDRIPALLRKAIERLYGREKVAACVDAIMRRPEKALPVLLQRMKNKDLEWREARRGFLKTWREQNEKYHYKAMDHQGINFKQIDSKKLRSKALLSEIETRYDARNEEAEKAGREPGVGPHMQLSYCDANTLDDAASLLLHHAKRQTAAAPHKEDRRKMRRVVEHFLPQLFFREQPTSGGWSLEDSDARDDDEHSGENGTEDVKDVPKSVIGTDLTSEKVVAGLEIIGGKNGTSLRAQRPLIARLENSMSAKPQPVGPLINEVRPSIFEDENRLFMCNNYWYLFLRLHHMLCERLKYIYREASKRAEEAEAERIHGHRNEPAAEMLGMRPKRGIDVEDYYVAFLDMVKSLLDGTMEANAFEETLREMFSTRAYLVFTIDKIVVNAVRQLTHIVTDRTSQELMRIFETERKRGNVDALNAHQLSLSANEHPYQKHVEGVLADQNCFKFIMSKESLNVSIELMDTDTVEWEEEEEKEHKAMQVERWEDYVDNYLEESHAVVATDKISSALKAGKEDSASEGFHRTAAVTELRRLLCKKPLFLPRNARGGRLRNCDKLLTRFDEASIGVPVVSSDVFRVKSSPVSLADRDEGEPSPVKKARMDDEELISSEGIGIGDGNSTGKRTIKYLLYRPRSLQRAREVHQSVSERLNGKFRSWHKEWSKEKVPELQQRLCSDWLLGKLDGVRPHRTKVLTLNEKQRPPYSPYNRYKVDWPSPSPPMPS